MQVGGVAAAKGANDLQAARRLLFGDGSEFFGDSGGRQGLKQLQEKDAENKAADVSPPGDSADGAVTAGGAEKLKEEPEAEEEGGRDLDKPWNEDDRNQGQDLRSRVQDEVSAHDPGDGPAGTDCRYIRVPVDNQVRDSRSQTAHQVEGQVTRVSEPVFDIVSKDVEKPHVAEDVPETAVQEHEGEEREELLHR